MFFSPYLVKSTLSDSTNSHSSWFFFLKYILFIFFWNRKPAIKWSFSFFLQNIFLFSSCHMKSTVAIQSYMTITSILPLILLNKTCNHLGRLYPTNLLQWAIPENFTLPQEVGFQDFDKIKPFPSRFIYLFVLTIF